MAIELHHLHPGHDDDLSRLKARIAELEKKNAKIDELAGTLIDLLKTLKKAIDKEAK